MTVDVLLRGGRVVDGTGAPARTADVAVQDGRVVAVGPDARADAHDGAVETLDCAGLVISPGFVDLHSHADFTLPATPQAATQLAQGVTTLLVGNCGYAPFPVADDGPVALQRQAGFLLDEMAWDWTDADGYARALAGARPAVNVALQVGHHPLRIVAMGDAGRPAEPAEVDVMRAGVEAAARQGVHGFSTGLIYAPARFADRNEVAGLVAAATAHGLLFSVHVRDEAARGLEAVAEAIDIAERTGARLELSHLKAMGAVAHGNSGALLEALDAAVDRGVDAAGDVYPFTASSTTLSTRVPAWVLDGGADALVHRLRDPSARRAAATEMEALVPATVDPDAIVVAGLPPGRHSDAVGLSITEFACREGLEPTDAVLALLVEHRGQVGIVNHSMIDADLDRIITHPRVSIASDGWVMRTEPAPGSAAVPHPRSFATAAITLGHYVRERGLLSLEQAVHKMSGLPASRLGLTGRGVVRPGAVADLAVWDPDRVAARSTYDDPWHLADGMEHVLLGGSFAWRDGRVTPHRRGRVLRRTTTPEEKS